MVGYPIANPLSFPIKLWFHFNIYASSHGHTLVEPGSNPSPNGWSWLFQADYTGPISFANDWFRNDHVMQFWPKRCEKILNGVVASGKGIFILRRAKGKWWLLFFTGHYQDWIWFCETVVPMLHPWAYKVPSGMKLRDNQERQGWSAPALDWQPAIPLNFLLLDNKFLYYLNPIKSGLFVSQCHWKAS